MISDSFVFGFHSEHRSRRFRRAPRRHDGRRDTLRAAAVRAGRFEWRGCAYNTYAFNVYRVQSQQVSFPLHRRGRGRARALL